MPRFPRDKSDTGIYHIMVRGINKMSLFQEKYDKYKFLEIISNMKSQGEYSLYAYCIMDNHAHLLVKEEVDPISRSMKRICVSYSYYYNKKHKRVGHVFQDRFKSEKIETDEYLLECIRYIHNNPVKASMVSEPKNHKYSSYNIYIGKDNNELDIIETGFPLSVFSECKKQALRQFIDFSTDIGIDNNFIDVDVDVDVDVDEIGEMVSYDNRNPISAIEDILNHYDHTIGTISSLKNLKERNLILKSIKEKTDISIREISKITGISKDIIHRA